MAGLWTWLGLQMTGTNWLLTYSDFGFPNGNTYSKIDPNKKQVLLFSELSVKRKLKTKTVKWQHSHKLAACAWGWSYDRLSVSTLGLNVGLLLWYVWEDSSLFQGFTFGADKLWNLPEVKNILSYHLHIPLFFDSKISFWKLPLGQSSQRMENSTRHRTDSVCHSSASCLALGQVMSQVRSLTVEPLCRDFSHDITESVNTLSKHLHLLERFTGSRGRKKRDAWF